MRTQEQPPIEQVTRRNLSTATSSRGIRLIAMVAAAIATSLVWLIANALGVDFALRASGNSMKVGLPAVVGFTLAITGIGWAVLALLERYTRRPATLWTRLAVTVFVLSVIPIFAEHATTGTRIALVLIHASVAAILIPLLRRSARATTTST
jgi:hypothetical protein